MANPDGAVRGDPEELLDGGHGIAYAALHPAAQPGRPQTKTAANARG
jgi:hypothetical protein